MRRLGEFLGGKSSKPEGFGEYDIQIIAEINHAPKLSIQEVVAIAQDLSASGADLIDFGCVPGFTFQRIGEYVAALKDEGLRVSVDSLNPEEIQRAAEAGAELVLSVNAFKPTICQRMGDRGGRNP